MNNKLPKISVNTKLCFLLALASLLVYANTLKNDYAIDDFIVIKNNTIVTRGIAGIPEIFRTSYFKGNLVASFDYYRPLSLAMFAIEYQIFGPVPFEGHLINILLFAGCIILLFLFLKDLPGENKNFVAFICCLLFALHPVNTEVVANIKSRDQLLCFFFAFFSLNQFIKYVHSGKITRLIAGIFLFFLSLLSKETSLTFLAVFPLIFFFYINDNKKRSTTIIISAIIAASVYFTIRTIVLGSVNGGTNTGFSMLDNILTSAPGLHERLATEILVLGRYLQLLLFPHPLLSDYSYHTISFARFNNIKVIFSLLVYVALIITGAYRLLKKNKDPYAFAIVFYLISISVFSNLFFLIAGIMAERFLFFAAIGFCLIIALSIEKFTVAKSEKEPRFKKYIISVFVLLPVIIFYAFLTINRNSQWYDNYTLYKADVKVAPDNCKLQYNLGTNLLISANALEQNDTIRKKQVELGINYLKKAISIYPALDLAYSEIANTYFHDVNYDSSEVYCKKALSLNPSDLVAMENLAAICFKSGRFEQSLELCRHTVNKYPDYARAYRNMGNCYMRLNSFDSAVYAYKASMSVEPSVSVTYERLAVAYKLAGNMDSAQKYLQIAQNNNPEFNY